ncbi:hypothetical protein [Candidatus Chlamydia sanziniae]|uniref:Uncharacterized protein n=1 Tax=Candidatus Chlamydia sanziniae TaxID=1806891 RepID=A0A1A9HVP7_9CHLA|nr:hypothetical protein [Candidatus Chlamydia sanziniae]ANH78491.1 hypothetical protein Cs308_0320 [Candidatus Chlamydia sanziniae]
MQPSLETQELPELFLDQENLTETLALASGLSSPKIITGTITLYSHEDAIPTS